MIILSIETSCDDTAISVVRAKGIKENPSFSILANNVSSQTKIHEEYGGVFPMMAKREHAKNIIPLLIKTLTEAKLLKKTKKEISPKTKLKIQKILEREPELFKICEELLFQFSKPKIDYITCTIGPGLEPALWIGLNTAEAISALWDIPIVPVNHMEGHAVSSLLKEKDSIKDIKKEETNKIIFPALALLISGGHTELVLVKKWGLYKIIGQTRDDAVGEAFDKVARMIGLKYPGGPEVSRLANEFKKESKLSFPRPMIHTHDYDFSFSGLKTSVLYHIQKQEKITLANKREIAKEFQNAITEVLVKKTFRAVKEYGIKTLLLGGGVASNTHIRSQIQKNGEDNFPKLKIYFPRKDLSTDNALMIAMAGYFQIISGKKINSKNLKVKGNMSL